MARSFSGTLSDHADCTASPAAAPEISRSLLPGLQGTDHAALHLEDVRVAHVCEPGVPVDAQPDAARTGADPLPVSIVTMSPNPLDPDDPVNSGYSAVDPDDPRVGTERGPGRRPGARKPGRRPGQRNRGKGGKGGGELVRYTPEEKRANTQRRIKKEVAKADFARRCVDLRRAGMTYQQIAEQMSMERHEPITSDRVRRAYLNDIRNVEGLEDMRYAELDILTSQAAKMRAQLELMDSGDGGERTAVADLEVYAKVSDSYLKYRERIAKLVGLDAPVKQHVMRDGPPVDGGSVHVGADGVTIRLPGSVNAYEDWLQLEEKGLIDVAGQVLELEAGAHEEVTIGMHLNDKAGVTLRPDADTEPGAEKKERVRSALEALEMLNKRDGGS